MLLRISFWGCCCLFATSGFAQYGSEARLLIDYEASSTTLEPHIQTMLQQVLLNWAEDEDLVKIEIVAHGDNRDLPEERAVVLKEFFEKEGFPVDHIDLTTKIDNNNQVQVTFIGAIKQQENHTVAKEVLPITNDHKKVYCAGASKKAEVFEIASYHNIDIKGAEGTEIKINRNDLVYEDGRPVREPIRIELKEFYTPQDIILADLHTMEGEEVLETGGMLQLNITAKGEKLALKAGRSANIRMSSKNAKSKKGMNLYFGKPQGDGFIDWSLQTRAATENATSNKDFNPNSFIKLMTKEVIDSVTTRTIQNLKGKNLVSNHYPNTTTYQEVHTHEEEYFDMELNYLSEWINVDKRFGEPADPRTEILVDVKGIPVMGYSIEGNEMTYSPRIALMLKERSVFLRPEYMGKNKAGDVRMKFERVPQGAEVVLVGILDTGETVLFDSLSLKAKKKTEVQQMELKVIDSKSLAGEMAVVAN